MTTESDQREKVEAALAEARQGNFAPMFELSDADHEYILAHGDHDRAKWYANASALWAGRKSGSTGLPALRLPRLRSAADRHVNLQFGQVH